MNDFCLARRRNQWENGILVPSAAVAAPPRNGARVVQVRHKRAHTAKCVCMYVRSRFEN